MTADALAADKAAADRRTVLAEKLMAFPVEIMTARLAPIALPQQNGGDWATRSRNGGAAAGGEHGAAGAGGGAAGAAAGGGGKGGGRQKKIFPEALMGTLVRFLLSSPGIQVRTCGLTLSTDPPSTFALSPPRPLSPLSLPFPLLSALRR